MFRSRQTIAFSIIVLYFIPILFLSLYSVNGGPNHTWTLFSLGLVFGLGGTLTLFLLMIKFESAVSSSRSEDDEEKQENSMHSLFEADQAHLDFDAIILNLNEELELKKRESEKLGKENLSLISELEALKNKQTQEKVIEEEERQEEEEEAKASTFENRALDISTIEQSLYGKDLRVEVTRL